MGKSTERARSYWASSAAQAKQTRAAEGRASRERQLGTMEQLLGTDEQIEGGLGVDASIVPYTDRFQWDEGTLHSLMVGAKGGYDNWNALHSNLASSNQMMEQAEEAARSGDFEKAAELRAAAEAGLTNVSGVQRGDLFKSAIKTVRNEDAHAKAALSNPMAQTVGSIGRLREGC